MKQSHPEATGMSWSKILILLNFLVVPHWAQSTSLCEASFVNPNSNYFEFSAKQRHENENSRLIRVSTTQEIEDKTLHILELPFSLAAEHLAFSKVLLAVVREPSGGRLYSLENESGDQIAASSHSDALEKAIQIIGKGSTALSVSDLEISAYKRIWTFASDGEDESNQIVLNYSRNPQFPLNLRVFRFFDLPFSSEETVEAYIRELLQFGILLPGEEAAQRTRLPSLDEPIFRVGIDSPEQFRSQFAVDWTDTNRDSLELGRSYYENLQREKLVQDELDAQYEAKNSDLSRVERRQRLIDQIASGDRDLGQLSLPELRLLYAGKLMGEPSSGVSIRVINQEVGYGVFAEKDYQAGEYIGEFTGFIRPFFVDTNPVYSIGFPKGFRVDAQNAGNFTRFVNHSQSSNARFIPVFYRGQWRIVLAAKAAIIKGQQILTTYRNFTSNDSGLAP